MRPINSIKDRLPFSMIFDYPNPYFKKGDSDHNRMFLIWVNRWANAYFEKNGYLLLNQLREQLGYPPIPEGDIVGWVKGAGDDFIDLGIFDYKMPPGYDDMYLIQPNIDGVIYDL